MSKIEEQTGFRLLNNPKPGTCPECAVEHKPEFPHNRDSLFYQYKFYDEYGRWPTWKDAMEHCTEDIKELWIQELTKRGIRIEQ